MEPRRSDLQLAMGALRLHTAPRAQQRLGNVIGDGVSF